MHKGLKRALGALLIASVLYSLLGFLILPGIALRIANQQLALYATLPARLERLQFNPFSLELSLWGLRIGEPDQQQLAFARLYADLQLDSLWRGALHLAAVELDGGHGEVRLARDGTLNLSRLFRLPERPQQTSEEPAGELFPLRIDRLRLSEASLRFEDLRPGEPVNLAYDSLNLDLHNLSTLAGDNAEMKLVASGPQGARIDWQGQFGLAPLASDGQLRVSGVRLQTFWPYVRDAVPLALKDGQLELSTDYRLSLAQGTELLLSNAAVGVAAIALDSPDGRPLLRLERLDIGETRVDLGKRQVLVGKLRSRNLETWAAREADGQLDWHRLLAGPPATASSPQPAPDATARQDAPAARSDTADKTTPAPAWQVLLRDVQLREYRVHLADRVPQQQVALELGPLDLDLSDFDSRGTSPFTLKLNTGLGQQGRLQAEGQAQLSPTTASLKVASRDIDLRLAQAYLSPYLRLELRSGQLGSDLQVDLVGTAPLRFSVRGSAQVDQLHSLDTLKERDFVRWQRLDLDGIDYRHGDTLNIDKVRLHQPYARFIINEDLSTNLNELLIAQPQAPAAASTPAGEPLGIRIGEVSIAEGSANFADFSLTPNFATAIQQLGGRIGTLDSRSTKPARVSLSGKVDRYAPMSVEGSLNPFDPLDSLDIATRFKQVELTTLTPYSGKFAGYRIRKGRLNLDLHYRISKGQLQAQNSVLVEQLQLGEKVDSPSAVDLPVRLAVALLKDPDGRIALQLPVQGDLNNPEFSVMPIVWKTLRNLVLRAAQAPFKFIGGLVSGGADMDLSQVSFAAGSAELDGPARAGLDTLAGALRERPALRLEVEGLSAEGSDGAPLAAQRLQREYQASYYKILQRRGDAVPAEPALLPVPEDQHAALLEGIYRSRLKQQPPAEWGELDEPQRAARLRDAVLQSWAQSKLLQRQLAQARAAAIKDYLVDRGGLADARIYLLDVSRGKPEADGRVASPLHLDSE
ncbi:DUF748 domain-containing protein [Pseudomonas lalucatii]|uniref:DUF748 domain-containing protein n=1 Tax=Pseudomonas lalucatii TaxID=1424203 RepID=A0ABS5Q0C2_9PSED|nr:DUF748 domain-containing protein [Pseudomonas lalucatii]MBS7662014.1 DUF748 domain-containing protein [Pseudomonas lalucatii]